MNSISSEGKAQIVDGCSGGLSSFYKKMFGKDISCRYCCDEHDVAYYEGGSGPDRRLADKRLQQCAARAGKDVPGWLEELRKKKSWLARMFFYLPFLRRAWRWLRSWIIYTAVRLAGWYFWNKG